MSLAETFAPLHCLSLCFLTLFGTIWTDRVLKTSPGSDLGLVFDMFFCIPILARLREADVDLDVLRDHGAVRQASFLHQAGWCVVSWF